MTKFFNTAGPCDPERNYQLPATARLPDVRRIIDQAGYFVLHAPRQTGKTTAIRELARELRAEGTYCALYLTVEVGAARANDLDGLDRVLVETLLRAARRDLPDDEQPPGGLGFSATLGAWAAACPKPLVLLIDEVDALRDDGLITFLRQLRAGYPDRPRHFPHSVCLVGLRDIRDYVVDGDRLGTASPFNIKVESLTLRDFLPEEVGALLRQHTDATGQAFTDAAVDRVWHFGRGQPWLTNALARLAVLSVEGPAPIDAPAIDDAAVELIRRQDTHLDSLAARLQEPRVRQILAPMIAGDVSSAPWPKDDVRFVRDLGLIRDDGGAPEIANPIYQQIVARTLSDGTAWGIGRLTPAWLGPDGRLDANQLLSAFLSFWRQNAEPLFQSAAYPEIAPHLVLMAWLDRVANGGGRVEREYAVGAGRLDLLLIHRDVRVALELKVWRDRRRDPAVDGLAQLDGYLGRLGLDTGWLVVFDLRTGQPPVDERTCAEPAITPAGRQVTVVRA
jgi:hypothetical protein